MQQVYISQKTRQYLVQHKGANLALSSNIVATLLEPQPVDQTRPIYVSRSSTITFAELRDRILNLAGYFKTTNIKSGDRVLLCMDDCPTWAVYHHAFILLGIIPVIISPRLSTSSIEDTVAKTDCRALIANQSILDEIRSTLPQYSRDFAELLQPQYHFALCDAYQFTDTEDVMFIRTSGTSGNGRIVVHVHRSFRNNVENVSCLPHDKNTIMFSPASLSFSMGWWANVFAAWVFRSTQILISGPDALKNYAEIINKYKVTLTLAAPVLLNLLLKDANTTFGSHLKTVVSGGEPLPAIVAKKFEQRFGIRVINLLGLTETVAVTINNNPTIPAVSVGRPLDGIELKIIDEDNNEVPVNTPGRLIIKSPTTTSRYYDDPEETALSYRGNWFYTNDVFTCDQLGNFYYVERFNNYVKIKSTWTGSNEIEELILSIPGISESTVSFANDADGFLKPIAFVVPEPGANISAIGIKSAIIKATKQNHLIPHNIYFVSALPKTLTGKRTKDINVLLGLVK